MAKLTPRGGSRSRDSVSRESSRDRSRSRDRSSSHDRGSQRRRGRSKSPSREEWDQAEGEDKQTHARRNPTLATETGLVNAGFGSAATIAPGRLEGTLWITHK